MSKQKYRWIVLGLLAAVGSVRAEADRQPGLIAAFAAGQRRAMAVVTTPELGLAADETPHPAIGPDFAVEYEGFLRVAEAGTYEFRTGGKLVLADKPVDGPVPLAAGDHAVRLRWQRTAGPAALGLFWRSEAFIEEPVPPAAWVHTPCRLPPAATGGPVYPSPPDRMAQTLRSLDCGKCHDRNQLATLHHRHPPEAMLNLITHRQRKWHHAATGPRLEPTAELQQLVADLAKLPRGGRQRQPAPPDPAVAEMVGTKTGLACITCHDFGSHTVHAESPGPNLLKLNDRISYDWFYRWMSNPGRLKPGVPMPAFFAHLPAAEQEQNIGRLWDYLTAGKDLPMPKELQVDPKNFRPQPTTVPMLIRTAMRAPDGRELQRAICVGFPGGRSYCFDAESCRLVFAWKGGFLDMAPHWQDKAGAPTPAVGEPTLLLPAGAGLEAASPARFLGYDMTPSGPVFRYQLAGATISHRITAGPDEGITQTFQVAGDASGIFYRRGGPNSTQVTPTGAWQDDRMAMTVGELRVVILGGQK